MRRSVGCGPSSHTLSRPGAEMAGGQGGRDRPAGIEQIGLLAQQRGRRRRPLRQMGRDLRRLPMGVDHHLPHAGLGHPVQREIEQRMAAQPQQRLGDMFGQRTHAQAKPGGQEDGIFGGWHARSVARHLLFWKAARYVRAARALVDMERDACNGAATWLSRD